MRAHPTLLFVTATRIGDAVLSTGVLGRLLDLHPGARITVVAGPVAAPLFRAVPGLARLIPLAKRPFAGHWLALYRRIVFKRWDVVVDLRGSILPWVLFTRRRWSVGKGDPAEHRVRHLARRCALDPVPEPLLWTLPEHEAAAARLVPAGSPVLAVAPTANWPGKIWPAERFVELIQLLTAPHAAFAGARVAVFAAPHERALAEPVLNAIPAERRIDMTSEGDLLTVAAALRRASVVIANDTGLMHMAAAMGVPTLGLFGPSPATLYAPWGPQSALVQTEQSYEELVGAADFDHRRGVSLMDGLSVDKVEAAVLALVQRARLAA